MRKIKVWNSIENTTPIQNEIIYYNGNLYPVKGRYMGQDFVQLDNGEIDQFDEWVSLEPGFKTIVYRHPENNAKVVVRGIIKDGDFTGDYKYNKMTWGVTISLDGCDFGNHDLVPDLGFENSVKGDVCRTCGKKF